jgi:hypothetical protein
VVAAWGDPIVIRAALGSVAWLGWLANNVPYELRGNVLLELSVPDVLLKLRVSIRSVRVTLSRCSVVA